MTTKDHERSGRPIQVTTSEIVDKIHGMILADQRVKVYEIAEAMGISTERKEELYKSNRSLQHRASQTSCRNVDFGASIYINPVTKEEPIDYDECYAGNEMPSDSELNPLVVQMLEPETNLNEQIDKPPLKLLFKRNKKKLGPVKKKRTKRTGQNKSSAELESDDDINQAVHCDLCDESYKNNVKFAFHSILHNTDKKYSCHMCDFKNSSKYHIEMHIRAHEGTSKYKCEICNKAFTVSTHAIEHKYFHTGEKPFQCEICGKHFMFSWFLTSHRRSQHWEIMTGMPLVKYDCPVCQKHYTSATGLKRHKQSKHNTDGLDLSVLCDICGKRLSSKEKLKFHRRTHTGYKPYACEVCTKSFTRKEQLKEHERVHTGEKPFICKYCGKGFSQRSPLRIHERTHTGERPYVCKLCLKGFISKGVMDTHMKNCSGIAAYATLS